MRKTTIERLLWFWCKLEEEEEEEEEEEDFTVHANHSAKIKESKKRKKID